MYIYRCIVLYQDLCTEPWYLPATIYQISQARSEAGNQVGIPYEQYCSLNTIPTPLKRVFFGWSRTIGEQYAVKRRTRGAEDPSLPAG